MDAIDATYDAMGMRGNVMAAAMSDAMRSAIREWCARSSVELGYLYGSRARAQERAESDWDVAIRFAGVPSAEKRETWLGDLQEALARRFHVLEDRFDVHDLDEMPLALQFRVLHDGVLLWETPVGAHGRFYVRVLGEYLDYRYYEEMHLARMRDRVREGRFGA